MLLLRGWEVWGLSAVVFPTHLICYKRYSKKKKKKAAVSFFFFLQVFAVLVKITQTTASGFQGLRASLARNSPWCLLCEQILF